MSYPQSIPAFAGKLAGDAYLTGVADAQHNLAKPLARLIAFADKQHESAHDGCGLTPGVDPCAPWCDACKALQDVPAGLLAAVRADRNH